MDVPNGHGMHSATMCGWCVRPARDNGLAFRERCGHSGEDAAALSAWGARCVARMRPLSAVDGNAPGEADGGRGHTRQAVLRTMQVRRELRAWGMPAAHAEETNTEILILDGCERDRDDAGRGADERGAAPGGRTRRGDAIEVMHSAGCGPHARVYSTAGGGLISARCRCPRGPGAAVLRGARLGDYGNARWARPIPQCRGRGSCLDTVVLPVDLHARELPPSLSDAEDSQKWSNHDDLRTRHDVGVAQSANSTNSWPLQMKMYEFPPLTLGVAAHPTSPAGAQSKSVEPDSVQITRRRCTGTGLVARLAYVLSHRSAEEEGEFCQIGAGSSVFGCWNSEYDKKRYLKAAEPGV
ncbi:hypothetical protein FB451DRAFT_1181893 [Mycena latifolia]|nr:hypothetical protein FB451DRAFT_1181893 [Mycena latifolia]